MGPTSGMTELAKEESFGRTMQYVARISVYDIKEQKTTTFEVILSRAQFLKVKREKQGMLHVPFEVKK